MYFYNSICERVISFYRLAMKPAIPVIRVNKVQGIIKEGNRNMSFKLIEKKEEKNQDILYALQTDERFSEVENHIIKSDPL